MDKDRVAQNLAAVEKHFHSEGINEVEAALETFTDDIVWEAPAPMVLTDPSRGRKPLPRIIENSLRQCVM